MVGCLQRKTGKTASKRYGCQLVYSRRKSRENAQSQKTHEHFKRSLDALKVTRYVHTQTLRDTTTRVVITLNHPTTAR